MDVKVFNLYTYVWLTGLSKWQCFHFSWAKRVFCDHSYLWHKNNFSHITRIDGKCHNDWQTDRLRTLITSVITEHMTAFRQSNKTDFRRELFSSELNFSTENHWPLLLKWIALLDMINRLKYDVDRNRVTISHKFSTSTTSIRKCAWLLDLTDMSSFRFWIISLEFFK